jgi:hypothetical protein
MVRMYFLTIFMLLACVLHAQAPCSNFNDPTNPQGNWQLDPVNDNVSYSSGSPNTMDGSQYLILNDLSGGSWFINPTDFKNIGQRFMGQCLYFDFYLEKDGNYGQPIHPTIHIISGNQVITFVANVTVTPNSGWVRVRAPIANATSSTLPSNADGTWTMASGTWADFNNVMNNSTAVMISPDITSSPSERVYYDNICIKSCDGCSADFKLDTSFSTVSNAATANLTILNPILFSTPGNPGSTYTVNWGDGSGTQPYIGSTLTHDYSNAGTYTICVTEMKDRRVICVRCFTFCYSKSGVPSKDITNTAVKSPFPELEAIAKAEQSQAGQKDIVLVPNPAKSYVDVQTTLSKRETVSVKLVDISGKVVLEKSENLDSGSQSIKLNTDKLAQGIYIVEVKSNGKTTSQKLLISK